MRRHVVVVGGGMAGLSAAFALTETPALRERFRVTLLQPGWRLGGKGASGRNLARHDRIEEHGLHLWFGFYENAFGIVRRCYAERGPEGALPTWDAAFLPNERTAYHERWGERLVRHDVAFPRDGRTPGDGVPLRAGEHARRSLAWASLFLGELRRVRPDLAAELLRLPSFAGVRAWRGGWSLSGGGRVAALDAARAALRRALAPALDDDLVRFAFTGLDLGLTVARGLRVDRVGERGFAALDQEDLRAWLARHGAAPETLATSPVVDSLYNAGFAFTDGDRERPDLAAGAGLRLTLRMLLGYKGAVMWRMQAGMGDVVMAPLHTVLERRGVDLRYFHRAERLEVSDAAVEALVVARQATVRAGRYRPLVQVGGLDCWPSAPLVDQLVEDVSGVDLEHDSGPFAARETWRRGADFDDLILAAPAGALPELCAPLLARSAAWRAMLAAVPTVTTLAAQVWFADGWEGLGWPGPEVVQATRPGALDTCADLSHLLRREGFGPAAASLAYLCGTVSPDADRDAAFAAGSADWWPAGAPVVDRYVRVNRAPSDRYTRTPTGRTRDRLRADGSGFSHLFLAGDWVRNGIEVACIEGACLSGLQAARAVSGEGGRLPGEEDPRWPAF